jgi:hypothetical protein
LEPGNDESAALDCQSYNSGQQENLHAIVFGCQGYGPGVEVPPEEGISQVFNQKCTAELERQTFECYELAPFTDFSLFVVQAESNPPQNCTQYTPEDIEQGAPTQESYLYSVYLSEQIGNGVSSVATGPDWTASFDTDTALLTMYANVVEKPNDTNSPTSDSSSTEAPSPSPTSAANEFVLRLGLVVMLAVAAMIG